VRQCAILGHTLNMGEIAVGVESDPPANGRSLPAAPAGDPDVQRIRQDA
jgi:hypothetical protein